MRKKELLRKIRERLAKTSFQQAAPSAAQEPVQLEQRRTQPEPAHAPVPPAVPVVPAEAAKKIFRIKLPAKTPAPIRMAADYARGLRVIDETYPIVVVKAGNRKINMAYARVKFDAAKNQLSYNIIEPPASEAMRKVISRTLEELHESLDVTFGSASAKNTVYQYVDEKIRDIWNELGIKLSAKDTLNAKYYIFREIIGLSKIDAIFHDPNIEDISCDGINLPIYVFHRNPLYGEMPTNVVFATADELDSFAIKLAQKCSRNVSVAAPLMDGSMPDGSRCQITYGTDIARKGSNFTIRKFFKVPLTPTDLINFGTADSLILAYLWLAIEKEKSILISGTTATGKTTFLNVLAMFIDPNLKIVSIEDTAEIQLIHTNWMPQVTRAGVGPTEYGAVDMDALLKAALRQRPDYLIVGEVRGREANVLFHAQATGHPGLSTIHADTVDAIIDRLTTRPISLPLSLLANLDIIVFLEKAKKEGKFVRRVGQIIEIEDYEHKTKELKTNVVFERDPVKDVFLAKESYILGQLAERTGWSAQDIQEEILRRASVLDWLKLKGIYHFRDVAHVINMYYRNPTQLFEYMQRK